MGVNCRGLVRNSTVLTFFQLGFFLVCISLPLSLCASEPSSLELNSGWQFRATTEVEKPELKQWHSAQVPGVIQTDLLHNGLIPDRWKFPGGAGTATS
jgi:hypothetical protein